MSDRDIDELFRRFADLDRDLKELRSEVNQMKWYQQHGTNGDVAYSTKTTKAIFEAREIRSPFNSIDELFDHLERDKPAQWPNETYTDYLKRIGEYNEAQVYEDDLK